MSFTNPDPRFPGRPQTLDFERLSEICVKQDDVASYDDVEKILSVLVDHEALIYVAQHRMISLMSTSPTLLMIKSFALPSLMASFVDGFAKGAAFVEAGGHREDPKPTEEPTQTGNTGEKEGSL